MIRLRGLMLCASVLLVGLGGCAGKKVEEATNRCRDRGRAANLAAAQRDCELCCRVALNTDRVEGGTGTVRESTQECICSVK